MQTTLAVVGGGAAGLVAALSAAQQAKSSHTSLRILVLERMDRVGKKILATGNGRCNLTNTALTPQCYHSQNIDALAKVLQQISPQDVLAFFAQAGLLCAQKEDGKVYPQSNQASAVLDVLRASLVRHSIEEWCGFAVQTIRQDKQGYTLLAQDGRRVQAQKIILCTGGKAMPSLGSDGSGYALAQALGHHTLSPYPCLVPVKTDSDVPKGLKGIKAFCQISFEADGKALAGETGEILFADYGLSGIPVMQLSQWVHRSSAKQKQFCIDFFPSVPQEELLQLLQSRQIEMKNEPLEQFLIGTVHKKIGLMLLKAQNFAPLSTPCAQLSKAQLEQLCAVLKGWRILVKDTLSWNQAQVTGGGVPLSEISTATLESKKASGVYLCGELLDAAGLCGGYNLHWAWSTGILAGKAAASSLIP